MQKNLKIKIGLFAAEEIGLKIAQFLKSKNHIPEILVLDSKNPQKLNKKIKTSLKIPSRNVIKSAHLTPKKIKRLLGEKELDLILLAWWPYIVKKDVLKIPRLGCLNFHPSFLPYNRGKHYYFWTLVENTPFGVSLHFADEGVDSGDIAFQSRIPKTWEDTGYTLFHKAKKEIFQLFKSQYPKIRIGKIPHKRQRLSMGSFHLSRELEDASRIDLKKKVTGKKLLNLIRGRSFPNGPSAWFEENGSRYEVRVKINKVKNK